MRVDSLSLHNFRNYVNLKLDFPQNVNIFIGQNAQGKTNVLEALYFGAMARSHRTVVDSEVVQWQQPAAAIDLNFTRQNVQHRLSFRFQAAAGKEIILNGHVIKSREVVGLLNVVLFSPEDLWLIKGTPAARRRFLDIEISQANPAYYRHLQQYNRVLAQRNKLLKKIRERQAKEDLLDTWDLQLAAAAAVIVSKRQQALHKLAMLANLMQRKLTGNQENLTISYYLGAPESISPSEATADWYQQMLLRLRQEDIRHGSTGVGPQRDDLILTINGNNLRTYGSQGQQRTWVLALKLAELEFIKSEQGEYPVLLLDDVMSELDEQRQEHLLAFIKERIQTFITTTDQRGVPPIKFAKYYRVADGLITE
jgi:DNA replication and repair protein RecF